MLEPRKLDLDHLEDGENGRTDAAAAAFMTGANPHDGGERPRFRNRRSGDHDRDRVATVTLLNFGNCARGWLLTKSILHFRPGVARLGPISVTHAPAPLATHGRRSR